MSRSAAFKGALTGRAPLIGTWIKTPSAVVTEVLAGCSLDAICFDAEHAPFGRMELDACIMAARASDMPALVRVPSSEPHLILNALDCGAAGVVVPHVRTPDDAAATVRSVRYGRGGRGYAGSSRAAGYTRRSMAEHLSLSNASTVLVAQIEDAEALDCIDEIAAVEGVDCLFIGRADLAVSLGCATAKDPRVIEAAELICRAGRARKRSVGMFVPSIDEVPHWLGQDVSLFLLESGQTFLIAGAGSLAARFAAASQGGHAS